MVNQRLLIAEFTASKYLLNVFIYMDFQKTLTREVSPHRKQVNTKTHGYADAENEEQFKA